MRNIMSFRHDTKLHINGPSGHCSHLDFHPTPEVQQVRQKVTLGHVDMSRGSIRIFSSFISKCMVYPIIL